MNQNFKGDVSEILGMKVLMCHLQASAPATAASAHQVNCVKFTCCVAHEEAALMPARILRLSQELLIIFSTF
jgi:hypothetical protein